MDRRAFLVAVGSLSAGCTGANEEGSPTRSPSPTATPTTTSTRTSTSTELPDFRPAADPWREIEESSTETSSTVRGTIFLPPNTYAVRFLSPKLPVKMELTAQVQSDSLIDVFSMERTEFERYREQQEFLLYGEASVSGAKSFSIEQDLPSGEHAIVFDHTTTATEPTGESVRIAFELTFSYGIGETATPTATPTTPRPESLPFGQFRTVEGVQITPLRLEETDSSGLPDRRKRAALTVVASNSGESPTTPPPIDQFVLYRDDEQWEMEGLSSWPERLYPGEKATQEVWFVVSKVISLSTLNAGYRYNETLLQWEN